jgi:L-rhamnose isomerase
VLAVAHAFVERSRVLLDPAHHHLAVAHVVLLDLVALLDSAQLLQAAVARVLLVGRERALRGIGQQPELGSLGSIMKYSATRSARASSSAE